MKLFKCSMFYCIFILFYVFQYSCGCRGSSNPPPKETASITSGETEDLEDPEVIFVCESESKGNITRWILRDNNSLISATELDDLNVIFYTNYTTVNFNCSENDAKSSTVLITNYTMRIFEKNEYITDSDNSSIICCLHFENSTPRCKIKKNDLENKALLIYDASENNTSAPNLYYYIVPAVVVIFIMLAFSVNKLREKVAKSLSIANNQSSAAKNSHTPLYADLDLPSPTERNKWTPHSNEESPYAQVIVSNTVSYGQTDSQEHYENLQISETPYAEIIKGPKV